MRTIVSTVLQSVLSFLDYFRLFFRLKCTASSPTLRVSSPFFTSIKAAPMVNNGLPSSSGTCVTSSMSITTKLIRKINFPTLMSTSSRTPYGCAIVLCAMFRVIFLGVSSPKLSVFTIDSGIKLMLALESHKAFLNSTFPIMQGMAKLLGFCIFTGRLFWIIALQVAVKFTNLSSANFLFLLRMSFRNLA